MKKKLTALLLSAVMFFSLLPPAAAAAGCEYGSIPLYIGNADTDYMAEELLKQIPLQKGSARGEIRSVCDWVLQNCTPSWNGTYFFDEAAVRDAVDNGFFEHCDRDIAAGKILVRPRYSEDAPSDSNQYIAYCASQAMLKRSGGSADYAALLAVLLGHLGFDCRMIDGADGSVWLYVLIGEQYFWLDIWGEQQAIAAGKDPQDTYFLVSDSSQWRKSHSWDPAFSDWLAGNSTLVAENYSYTSALVSGRPWQRCSGWAEPLMAEAYRAGLIPSRFLGRDLRKPITRAAFATVAVSLCETLSGTPVPAYQGQNPFVDTDDPDVLRAYSLGLVAGYGEGLYLPDQTITREEAATILGHVYQVAHGDPITDGSSLVPEDVALFADDESIYRYAWNFIYFFAGAGVFEGVGGRRFAPKDPMTCEEAITVHLKTSRLK